MSESRRHFSLGWLLLHWRMKWIFAFGLGFGVLRFALSAFNTKNLPAHWHRAAWRVIALVFITAQIYLEQRVDHGLARAGAGVADP